MLLCLPGHTHKTWRDKSCNKPAALCFCTAHICVSSDACCVCQLIHGRKLAEDHASNLRLLQLAVVCGLPIAPPLFPVQPLHPHLLRSALQASCCAALRL